MSDMEHSAERLSSLVDGELHGAELARAVDAAKGEREAQARWSRYHVAIDAMKKSLPPVILKDDFADRVMRAIESEPTVLAPRRSATPGSTIRKPLAGLAVAASVTAVVVLGARNTMVGGVDPAPLAQAPQAEVVQQVASVPTPPKAAVAVSAGQPAIPANVQLQLNRYLLNHNQNAVGMNGMLPYARIVGYSNGESAE